MNLLGPRPSRETHRVERRFLDWGVKSCPRNQRIIALDLRVDDNLDRRRERCLAECGFNIIETESRGDH